MTRSITTLAGACLSAALLLGATAYSANAAYLGYGNGDAGNADFWAEQGVAPSPPHAAPHHAMAAHRIHRTAHHTAKKPEAQKTAHHATAKTKTQHS